MKKIKFSQIEEFLSECHLRFMLDRYESDDMVSSGIVYIYHKKTYVGQFYMQDNCVMFDNELFYMQYQLDKVCDTFTHYMNKIFRTKFDYSISAEGQFPTQFQ